MLNILKQKKIICVRCIMKIIILKNKSIKYLKKLKSEEVYITQKRKISILNQQMSMVEKKLIQTLKKIFKTEKIKRY